MDKHMEIFCAQNPKFELECDNPECKTGGIHVFASKDVFKSNILPSSAKIRKYSSIQKNFRTLLRCNLKKLVSNGDFK